MIIQMEMKKTVGQFTVIGVGPGDPELLTIRAVRMIQSADVVAIPVSGGEGTNLPHAGYRSLPD